MMTRTFACLGLAALILFAAVCAASAETEFRDTAHFTGMPNYQIYEGDEKEFDAYNFYNGTGCVTVEGRKYYRAYMPKEGSRRASDLQISRNYANAIRSMGGTVVFDGECSGAQCAENCGYRMVVGKVQKGGNELWAEIVPWNDGDNYSIVVVVKEAMKQEVTARAMFDALNREGHIALYINFDTGKSTIKADSKPVVEEVVRMMKDNPGLSLRVEGHTDNAGSAKANKTLSEERAKAVVAALVSQGIDAVRLSAAGHGQDKPVADNKTEEGRAKNRRVELVRQ